MIRSKRARTKHEADDSGLATALRRIEEYNALVRNDEDKILIRHLKMPVMQAHELRMLTGMTTGLHPRLGQSYHRVKMVEQTDAEMTELEKLRAAVQAKHSAKVSENPCCEVELPGVSHPAIEMKMPDYEDMIRHYSQVYEIET